MWLHQCLSKSGRRVFPHLWPFREATCKGCSLLPPLNGRAPLVLTIQLTDFLSQQRPELSPFLVQGPCEFEILSFLIEQSQLFGDELVLFVFAALSRGLREVAFIAFLVRSVRVLLDQLRLTLALVVLTLFSLSRQLFFCMTCVSCSFSTVKGSLCLCIMHWACMSSSIWVSSLLARVASSFRPCCCCSFAWVLSRFDFSVQP